MILEHADITIPAGRNAEFEEAIQRGIATVISTAKGFVDARVHKGIESPERYILTIHWETLENHTVDFRGGPLFPAWRAIVGPFFAKPPVVEHFDLVPGVIAMAASMAVCTFGAVRWGDEFWMAILRRGG